MDYNAIIRLKEIISKNPEKAAELEKLTAKIKRGESTGDTLKDFEIMHCSLDLLQGKTPIVDIASKLKVDEPVLLVHQHEEPLVYYMFPHRENDRTIIKTDLKLGILKSGLEAKIQGEYASILVIPTGKHVLNYSGREWEQKEGDLTLNWMDMFYLNNDLGDAFGINVRETNDHVRDQSIKIYAGREVEEYFTKGKVLDTSYVDALKMLGHEAPEKFKSAWEKKRSGDTYNLIFRLEGLVSKYNSLVKQIEKINKRAVGSDAMYASYQDEQELNHTQESIKSQLLDAVKLELYKEDKVLEFETPGKSIDVRKYITALCKQHGVKI